MRINNKLPVRLSERAIESNVLRYLAHCLEERCGMKRNDILFHMPTQREENNLGYDAMVVGVWVALQFKRAECARRDGVARFTIDLRQAKKLKDLLPRGCAFYALTPIAELNQFIISLPCILDKSYLVDAHDIPSRRSGEGTISLWVAKGGEAWVRNGKKKASVCSSSTSTLCCPAGMPTMHVGFSVDQNGEILYRVKSPDGYVGALEPWPHKADYIGRQLGSAAALRLSSTPFRERP